MSGRTERYIAYDLVTAAPGDIVTVELTDPYDHAKASVVDLVKDEAEPGESSAEHWTLVSDKVGEAAVRLVLYLRMKGGGVTALHQRVVLRRELELGVGFTDSDRPNQITNLGRIAVVYANTDMIEGVDMAHEDYDRSYN